MKAPKNAGPVRAALYARKGPDRPVAGFVPVGGRPVLLVEGVGSEELTITAARALAAELIAAADEAERFLAFRPL